MSNDECIQAYQDEVENVKFQQIMVVNNAEVPFAGRDSGEGELDDKDVLDNAMVAHEQRWSETEDEYDKDNFVVNDQPMQMIQVDDGVEFWTAAPTPTAPPPTAQSTQPAQSTMDVQPPVGTQPPVPPTQPPTPPTQPPTST
ncbi:hypothetical protein APHAL10511_008021 [Amanita phalloides]|nr:hypothetical protein APHAL10511_008021 [Amanita phalloides]